AEVLVHARPGHAGALGQGRERRRSTGLGEDLPSGVEEGALLGLAVLGDRRRGDPWHGSSSTCSGGAARVVRLGWCSWGGSAGGGAAQAARVAAGPSLPSIISTTRSQCPSTSWSWVTMMVATPWVCVSCASRATISWL